MAHYILKLVRKSGNCDAGFIDNVEYGGSAIGEIYDSEGNLRGWHDSTTLDWLEHDLLREVPYNSDMDTYEKNW